MPSNEFFNRERKGLEMQGWPFDEIETIFIKVFGVKAVNDWVASLPKDEEECKNDYKLEG